MLREFNYFGIKHVFTGKFFRLKVDFVNLFQCEPLDRLIILTSLLGDFTWICPPTAVESVLDVTAFESACSSLPTSHKLQLP